MPFALLLACAAAAGGTLTTYLYDEDAHLASRAAAGVCIGFAALGLFGFVLASVAGLAPLTSTLAGALTAAPLALLARPDWRARLRFDLEEARRDLRDAFGRPSLRTTAPLTLFACAALLFWLVYSRAMFERGGEIFTGVDNNLGDLPFHLSIITGFTDGRNFPPSHPEYAGARLTYPFIVDFVAAMFARAGATLEQAMFWENLLLALALVVLLYRFALRLTGDRLAALLAPVLTLLSGGLGFVRFYREAGRSALGFMEFLWQLPHDYTITYDGVFRWGNAITTLLVPQRGLLMGLPLALVVMTQWWLATCGGGENVGGRTRSEAEAAEGRPKERKEGKKGKKGKGKKGEAREIKSQPPPFAPIRSLPLLSGFGRGDLRLLGAGLVAGLLPLVHAHTFVVLMLVGGCLALLFPQWRGWIAFFAFAFVVAAPQMLWATRGSASRASSFFAWQLGWDRGEQNPLWFWLMNAGLFIPLLVVALAWREGRAVVPKRLLVFYLPFTLLFVVGNAAKVSPWVWDNIKVLFYWYTASAPLVALLLARLWRTNLAARVGTLALLAMLTASGALDVWRVVSAASEQREFDRGGVAFAELIRRETAPRALILHAPTYNHPVYLTGRQSLMGYGGHLWSQGIDYQARESDVSRIYAGAPDAEQLLARYGVEYAVVGPLERTGLRVNEQFFTRFEKIGETGGYSLYKIARR